MRPDTTGPSRTNVLRSQTCSVVENCPSYQIMQPLTPHGSEALLEAACHPPSATVLNPGARFQPAPGVRFLASQVASVLMVKEVASADEAVTATRPTDKTRHFTAAEKTFIGPLLRTDTSLDRGNTAQRPVRKNPPREPAGTMS